MSQPLITILVRVSRIEQFYEQCLLSIVGQTYQNYQIICACDKADVYHELRKSDKFKVIWTLKRFHIEFDYNLYCNGLKERVEDGWFLFLDDDDYLVSPTCLEEIAEDLTDPDELIICQMYRKDRRKPADMYMDMKSISRGRIGMPCFILHAKHKHVSEFVATEDADYLFIKEASEKLKTKFIKKIIVHSPKRSFGK